MTSKPLYGLQSSEGIVTLILSPRAFWAWPVESITNHMPSARIRSAAVLPLATLYSLTSLQFSDCALGLMRHWYGGCRTNRRMSGDPGPKVPSGARGLKHRRSFRHLYHRGRVPKLRKAYAISCRCQQPAFVGVDFAGYLSAVPASPCLLSLPDGLDCSPNQSGNGAVLLGRKPCPIRLSTDSRICPT
jgi:hypothetical protein